MFGEALKLYLKYPAEMEYWAGKDKGEIDKTLVSEIAEEEGDAFLSALSKAHELALEQFKDSIMNPLKEVLNKAANKKSIALSLRGKKCIAGQNFGGRVRSKNNKGEGFYRSIGCYFWIEKSGDESVLNVYPWVWTKGGRVEVQRLVGRLGDGWCVGDEWTPGSIKHEPRISIGPKSKSEAVVKSIAGCLVPHVNLLAQEATHPTH
jgi:hypothetical protein